MVEENENMLSTIKVMRVAGGWIYRDKFHGAGNNTTSGSTVFVPFNNEFQKGDNFHLPK